MSPGLYCIELRSSQWELMVQWYRSALGLRVLVRMVDDGYALLEAGETRLALIARAANSNPSPRWSLAFETDNLDLAAARLMAAGSSVTRLTNNPEGLRDLMTADPDGNQIRLFSWPEREE
jgi:predicted enzyme related to lactoylglutathione lyase